MAASGQYLGPRHIPVEVEEADVAEGGDKAVPQVQGDHLAADPHDAKVRQRVAEVAVGDGVQHSAARGQR